MQQVADALRRTAESGHRAVVGRVIELKGFSTLPVDEMVVIDEAGTLHGDLLGRPGAEKLTAAAKQLLGGGDRLQTVGVSIHGPEIKELGLSCGGQADVLLQPVASIPAEFWAAVAARSPVALATIIDGPAAGPDALAFDRDGAEWGRLPPADQGTREAVADAARALLRQGRTGSSRIETAGGVALVEAWVPMPRLVVVGGGEIAEAIEAQAGLLGWETRATEAGAAHTRATEAGAAAGDGEVEGLLDWAGATAALIVTSHDPHVDAPALAAGLARPTPYIGAMGSRGTQSRRLERLTAQGIPEEQLNRIHRPIGLNLGGRRASEVALAIVAEILSVHCGRDGRPLRETTGPIHG